MTHVHLHLTEEKKIDFCITDDTIEQVSVWLGLSSGPNLYRVWSKNEPFWNCP